MYSFKCNKKNLVVLDKEDYESCENENHSDTEGKNKFNKYSKYISGKKLKSKGKKFTQKYLSKKNAIKNETNSLDLNLQESGNSEFQNQKIDQAIDNASTILLDSQTLLNNGSLINNENSNMKNNNIINNNKKDNENGSFKKMSNSCEYDIENVPLEYVEASYNYPGNYQNYISRVICSLSPISKINFENHIQDRIVLLPEYNKKKTLILDLDETLIHADFDGRFENHDQRISFLYDEQEISVDIFIRPGVFEFLKNVSEIFEIFIFTASKKEYADAVLDFLDPQKKIFKHRLYRDNCIPINNRIYLKDLRIFINRKPENIILVDNSFYSFCNQPRNGVLINSFYNDKQDRELVNLLNYLQNYLYGVSDVRIINEQIFNFETLISQYKNIANDKVEKDGFFDG